MEENKYMHLYMHICVYIYYTYKHTHTYTHTHTRARAHTHKGAGGARTQGKIINLIIVAKDENDGLENAKIKEAKCRLLYL